MAKINYNGYDFDVNTEKKKVTMKPMFDKHGESYTFILKQVVKDDNQKMILSTMEWMAQDVARIKWATSKDAKGQLIYKLPCVNWILPVARNTRATWVTDSSSQNVRNEVRNALIAYFKAALKDQDNPKKPEPPKAPEQHKKADSKDAAADYGQQLLAQAMIPIAQEESKEANSSIENRSTLPTVYLSVGYSGSNWNATLRMGEHIKNLNGIEDDTSHNRIEIIGAVYGLRALKRPCHVVLTSKSDYLVKGINENLDKLLDRGWEKSNGELIENIELWKELDELTQRNEVEAFKEEEPKEESKVVNEEIYEDGTSDDLLGCDEAI